MKTAKRNKKLKNSLCFIFALFFFGYATAGEKNDSLETVEINGVTISKYLLYEIQSACGVAPNDLTILNHHSSQEGTSIKNWTDTIHHGFFFGGIPEFGAIRIVEQFSEKCRKNGNFIYLQNYQIKKSFESIYDVTIVKANNQFEVIKLMNCHGTLYGVSNTMVIDQLKKWDDEMNLNLLVIQENIIVANFENSPKRSWKFSREIAVLCPEYYKQNPFSLLNRVRRIKKEKSFWLWWN